MTARKYTIRFIPMPTSRRRDKTVVWIDTGREVISIKGDEGIVSKVRQWAADNGAYMSKTRAKRVYGVGPFANRGYLRMTADQVFAFKMRWA